MSRYRIKPGSFRVDIPYLETLMSAEVASVPADPIDNLPVTNTVNWASFIHRYGRIIKPDGRIARAFNTVVTNGGTNNVPLTGVTNGDPGLEGRAERIEIEAGDGVIIYRQRVPVVAWSRIDGSTFKKKWRTEFNATYPQTKYPPPQPNVGPDRAATVNPSTGLARLSFTADPKFWSGSGTVLWNLPDSGATLVAGYALTDLTIEVDFEPGQYEMVCIAEDTGFPNTPIQRAFRNVYVKGDGFQPFSEVANIVAIEGDRTDLLGRSCTLVVRVDRNTDLSDYLYAGASVLLSYQVQGLVAGVWTNQTDSITAFKGYLSHISPARYVGGKVEYRLLVENPLLYFRRLGIASQVLQAVSPPTNWLEVDGSLSHLAFVIYYLLEYNAPSLVQYVDIDFGDFEDYVFPDFSFASNTLTSTAQAAAGRRPLGNIGCTSDGTITMRDHPAILSAAQRAALGSKYTWTARKVREGISYERNPIPTLNRLRGNSFAISDGEGYEHEANLLAPGYGANDDEIPDFLALTPTEASEIVGRMIAYESRPTLDLSWTVNGMIDVTDPPEMIPHTMNMADYDPLAGGMFSNLVMPVSVERNWKMTRTVGDKEVFDPRFDVNIVAEPETDAPAAPTCTEPDLGNTVAQTWCYYWPVTELAADWTLVRGIYETGVGFYSAGGATDQVRLSITPGGTFTVTQVEFIFNAAWGGISPRNAILAPSTLAILGSTTAAGTTTVQLSYTYSGTAFMIDCDRYVNNIQAWGTLRLVGLRLRGTGSNPFGADNCT